MSSEDAKTYMTDEHKFEEIINRRTFKPTGSESKEDNRKGESKDDDNPPRTIDEPSEKKKSKRPGYIRPDGKKSRKKSRKKKKSLRRKN